MQSGGDATSQDLDINQDDRVNVRDLLEVVNHKHSRFNDSTVSDETPDAASVDHVLTAIDFSSLDEEK